MRLPIRGSRVTSREEASWPPTSRRKPPDVTSARSGRRKSARARGEDVPRSGEGLSTADKDRLADQEFAFSEERKEPLSDARNVRNAIARFNQVEGVSDAERDMAWKRIRAAAKRFDVEVSESDWRDLAKGGKDRKR